MYHVWWKGILQETEGYACSQPGIFTVAFTCISQYKESSAEDLARDSALTFSSVAQP